MATSIAATVFILLALTAAFFLRPKLVENSAMTRGLFFWFAITPLAYFIFPILGALAAAAALLVVLTPKGVEDRIAYYIIAIFALPNALKAEIPFPGINYLDVIDFQMIACLLLLAPVIVTGRKPNASRHAPVAGILVLLLTMLVTIQEFRTENITNGLRIAINFAILFPLPFMAIIRLAPQLDSFEKIFSGLLMLGVIFACLAFVSEATNWNFYTFLTERHGIAAMADIREGILRVAITVIPVLAGYVALLGFLAGEYFRMQGQLSTALFWLYRIMFFGTLIFTFARGAWLAMAVGAMTFYFFTKFPRSVRPALMTLGAVVVAPASVIYIMTANLDRFDPYGTFEYRRELLNASFIQIRQHPLFGDPNFLYSGNFDNLYQGQGIIDVVNYYLQITLKHGLVGLALFAGAFLSAIFGLLSLGKIVRRNEDTTLERRRAVMLGAIIGYVVLIATVSDVTLIPHAGVIVLALATAFVAAARKEHATLNAPEAAGNQTGLTGEPAAASSPPAAAIKGDLFD